MFFFLCVFIVNALKAYAFIDRKIHTFLKFIPFLPIIGPINFAILNLYAHLKHFFMIYVRVMEINCWRILVGLHYCMVEKTIFLSDIRLFGFLLALSLNPLNFQRT